MAPISYRRHRFPPVVIQHAVWLYLRFTLSYRDVEELLAERVAAAETENPGTRRRRRVHAPFTTILTFSATSSPDRRCGSSEPKRQRNGKTLSRQHEV